MSMCASRSGRPTSNCTPGIGRISLSNVSGQTPTQKLALPRAAQSPSRYLPRSSPCRSGYSRRSRSPCALIPVSPRPASHAKRSHRVRAIAHPTRSVAKYRLPGRRASRPARAEGRRDDRRIDHPGRPRDRPLPDLRAPARRRAGGLGPRGRAVAGDPVRGRPARRPDARCVHRRDRPLDAQPHDGQEHARFRGPGPGAHSPGGRGAVPAPRGRGPHRRHDPSPRAPADRRVRGARRGGPVQGAGRADVDPVPALHARAGRGAVGGPQPLERRHHGRPGQLRGRPREAGRGRQGQRRAGRRRSTRSSTAWSASPTARCCRRCCTPTATTA